MYSNPGQVWDLGFEDNDLNAFFGKKSISMLTEFCKVNPEFHIVTKHEGKVYNRLVPEYDQFYFADGDPDPSLEAVVNFECTDEELRELGKSEFFTHFNELQRDGELPSMDELLPKRVLH